MFQPSNLLEIAIPNLYYWSSCSYTKALLELPLQGILLENSLQNMDIYNLSSSFYNFHPDFKLQLFDVFFSDKVYPLPQNWPKIPQVFRRKSCELTKNTSPCVNKAVSHLELIQGIIEEWFKEREEECKDQAVALRQGNSYGTLS